MKPALKDCPFCGGKAKYHANILDREHVVRCAGNECLVRPSCGSFYGREDAEYRWNRRAPRKRAKRKGEKKL